MASATMNPLVGSVRNSNQSRLARFPNHMTPVQPLSLTTLGLNQNRMGLKGAS